MFAYRIREPETNPAAPEWLPTGNGGIIMDWARLYRARLGTIAGLAALTGTAGTVLPAIAAPGPVVQPAVAAVAASALPAQTEASRARPGKPIVMLVCREVRGGRRGEAARSADLACVTRWAGF